VADIFHRVRGNSFNGSYMGELMNRIAIDNFLNIAEKTK
jgi:hypothetical protein